MMNVNFLKPIIFLFTAVITCSALAATNTDVVIMKNVTYCHLLSTGGHVIGNVSFIDSYLEGGEQGGDQYRFSSLDPGSSGEVPLIKKNGRQYILLDHGDAADVYAFNYTDGDKYILGYEDPTSYCKHQHFPPCLTISKVNPCG